MLSSVYGGWELDDNQFQGSIKDYWRGEVGYRRRETSSEFGKVSRSRWKLRWTVNSFNKYVSGYTGPATIFGTENSKRYKNNSGRTSVIGRGSSTRRLRELVKRDHVLETANSLCAGEGQRRVSGGGAAAHDTSEEHRGHLSSLPRGDLLLSMVTGTLKLVFLEIPYLQCGEWSRGRQIQCHCWGHPGNNTSIRGRTRAS